MGSGPIGTLRVAAVPCTRKPESRLTSEGPGTDARQAANRFRIGCWRASVPIVAFFLAPMLISLSGWGSAANAQTNDNVSSNLTLTLSRTSGPVGTAFYATFNGSESCSGPYAGWWTFSWGGAASTTVRQATLRTTVPAGAALGQHTVSASCDKGKDSALFTVTSAPTPSGPSSQPNSPGASRASGTTTPVSTPTSGSASTTSTILWAVLALMIAGILVAIGWHLLRRRPSWAPEHVEARVGARAPPEPKIHERGARPAWVLRIEPHAGKLRSSIREGTRR